MTFTDKAAGELRARLAALGVERRARRDVPLRGARASCATSRRTGRRGSSRRRRCCCARSATRCRRRTSSGRRATSPTEIEWAKNRRIAPERYLAALGDHEPPIPPDLMSRVYREYERRKARAGAIDFEDLLERAIAAASRRDDAARARRSARSTAPSPSTSTRTSTCSSRRCSTSGSATATTSASSATTTSRSTRSPARAPEHLLGDAAALPARDASCGSRRTTARRRRCSRSRTGSCRSSAAPRRRCARRAPTGRSRPCAPFASARGRGAAIVERIRALDVPLEEHRDPLPHERAADRLRGGAARGGHPVPGLVAARPRRGAPAAAAARADGGAGARAVRERARGRLARELPEKLGERELTRQTDLARLVTLAEEFDGDAARAFVAELRERFDSGGDGARGVNLLTLHRAKGLEFDTVFLPRLEEKELPSRQARTRGEIDEERRLLYVGMTRAKRVLALTWSGKPAAFLAELGVAGAPPAPPARRRRAGERTPAAERARAWRLERAREDGVPAYVVFHDTTLHEIAARAAALARRARRRSRASARRSSSATATRCSRRSRGAGARGGELDNAVEPTTSNSRPSTSAADLEPAAAARDSDVEGGRHSARHQNRSVRADAAERPSPTMAAAWPRSPMDDGRPRSTRTAAARLGRPPDAPRHATATRARPVSRASEPDPPQRPELAAAGVAKRRPSLTVGFMELDGGNRLDRSGRPTASASRRALLSGSRRSSPTPPARAPAT